MKLLCLHCCIILLSKLQQCCSAAPPLQVNQLEINSYCSRPTIIVLNNSMIGLTDIFYRNKQNIFSNLIILSISFIKQQLLSLVNQHFLKDLYSKKIGIFNTRLKLTIDNDCSIISILVSHKINFPFNTETCINDTALCNTIFSVIKCDTDLSILMIRA